MKSFAGPFHWAQTSNLWRVYPKLPQNQRWNRNLFWFSKLLYSYGYMSLIWKWNPQTTFQYQFHYTPLNSNALGGHEPDLCYNITDPTLFRNKRFALNEMFQQNTSKFAVFYVYIIRYLRYLYETPKLQLSVFHFVLCIMYFFSPNECPELCQRMLT